MFFSHVATELLDIRYIIYIKFSSITFHNNKIINYQAMHHLSRHTLIFNVTFGKNILRIFKIYAKLNNYFKMQ